MDEYFDDKRVCQKCSSPCLTCENLPTTCLSCENGYHLALNGTPICDKNICTDRCDTCEGYTELDCLSCINGFFLKKNEGPIDCVTKEKCPNGTYPDSDQNKCQDCDSSCKECIGPKKNQCKICLSGNQFFNNYCLPECPDKYFSNNGICELCHSSCKNCDGATNKSCICCDMPRFYLEKQCLTICPDKFYGDNFTLSCVKDCPEFSFPDEDSKICYKCDNKCPKCRGIGSNECLSCQKNLFLEDGSCVEFCSSGFFVDTGTSKCESNFFFL